VRQLQVEPVVEVNVVEQLELEHLRRRARIRM
jgi:hypothetical protein